MILCGCADLSVHSKKCEKAFDFFLAHFSGVSFVMKENEARDPVDVGLFGLVTIIDFMRNNFLSCSQPPFAVPYAEIV